VEKYLCIDQGNTNTRVAHFHGNEVVGIEKFPSAELRSIIERCEQYTFDYWIISSVSDPSNLGAFLLGLKPGIMLSESTPLPFASHYRTLNTIGKDRLAAIAGAMTRRPDENLLVIDAGTCITYDVLSAEKVHLGGLIIPGIEMRYRAMHHFTARLPLVQIPDQIAEIGDSTVSCLQFGGLMGALAEYEGIFERYTKRYGISGVIVTGGDARWFGKLGKREIFVDFDLVLVGLRQILSFNVRGKD
jgi:type III pantothenate kinase